VTSKLFAGDFTAGDHLRGGGLDGSIGRFDGDFRLVFGGSVKCDYHQAFGFYLGGIEENEIGFHGVAIQYRRRTGKCARRRPLVVFPDRKALNRKAR